MLRKSRTNSTPIFYWHISAHFKKTRYSSELLAAFHISHTLCSPYITLSCFKPFSPWAISRIYRKSKNRKGSLNCYTLKWATKALYLIYTPYHLKSKNRRQILNCYTLNAPKKHHILIFYKSTPFWWSIMLKTTISSKLLDIPLEELWGSERFEIYTRISWSWIWLKPFKGGYSR
jgi:hypothetical protein